MRLPVKFSLCSAVLVLGLLASTSRAYAQVQTTAQSTSTQPTGNGTYIVVDPLANVKYDNKYDVSLGMAYDHMKAGPNLLQGSNLGGLNLSGSYWFSRHWGVEGSGRSYWGTSGAAPNAFVSSAGQTENIQGPFVAQYFFVAGPEWLGPHNKHGALIAHAMLAESTGISNRICGQSPAIVGFYNDQVAPGCNHWRAYRFEPFSTVGFPRHPGRGHHPLQHQLRDNDHTDRCEFCDLRRRDVPLQSEAQITKLNR